MAQKIIMQLVDDLTGEDIEDENGETVSFALDGQSYSIDLTRDNADQFRGLFHDYIAVATKSGKKTSSRGRSNTGGAITSKSSASAKEIREWARSNGHEVPDRGRIPETVREAYDSAH